MGGGGGLLGPWTVGRRLGSEDEWWDGEITFGKAVWGDGH